MYDKDLDGIWVEGEAGYKEARDFMRMLMPSQAKKVIAYREPAPLFVKHKVEDHLGPDLLARRAAALGRLSGDQPDRGPGRRRRQLGQRHARAQHRGHRAEDQHGGRRGSLPASCACATWPA